MKNEITYETEARVALNLQRMEEIERLDDSELADAVQTEVWFASEPGSRADLLTAELLRRYETKTANI